MTKLIVLDMPIGSMTEFKQIIGRGTRLRADEGKTHFVVMDFRGVRACLPTKIGTAKSKSTKDSIPTQRPCRSVRGAVPNP